MPDATVKRTLVKSPPELWAEISDVESLARHLGEFGRSAFAVTGEAGAAGASMPGGWGICPMAPARGPPEVDDKPGDRP